MTIQTSKSCLKNLAVSMFTPIAANTIAKLSSESSRTDFPGNLTNPACLQIWAAIYLNNFVSLINYPQLLNSGNKIEKEKN